MKIKTKITLVELSEVERQRAILGAQLNSWAKLHRDEAIVLVQEFGSPRPEPGYNPSDQICAWLVFREGAWLVEIFQNYWAEYGNEYYCRATFSTEELGLEPIN